VSYAVTASPARRRRHDALNSANLTIAKLAGADLCGALYTEHGTATSLDSLEQHGMIVPWSAVRTILPRVLVVLRGWSHAGLPVAGYCQYVGRAQL
jgi:hypothetical protein